MSLGHAAIAAALVLGLTGSSHAVSAQPTKFARIGVVSGDSPGDSPCVLRLRQGLSELGYVEGKTQVLEVRWAEGRTDVIPSLAADLVRMNVDVIVSAAGPAALAVKEATTSIPIVLASSFYPVELGLIASLARPGGNVTGVTHFTPELMAKRVQLLKDLLPKASRFAVLRLPGGMQDFIVRDMEAAARQLGVQLQVTEVRRVEDLPAAFDAAVSGHAPGGSTGWHYHDGQVIAVVKSGTLTRTLHDCSTEATSAGASFVEPAGPDRTHIGRNLGTEPVVLLVTYVLPAGRPLSRDVPQPSQCGQ